MNTRKLTAAVIALVSAVCTLVSCGSAKSSSSEGTTTSQNTSTTADNSADKTTGSTAASTAATTTAAASTTTVTTQAQSTETSTEAGTKDASSAPYSEDVKKMIAAINDKDVMGYFNYMYPSDMAKTLIASQGKTLEELKTEMTDDEDAFPIELVSVTEEENLSDKVSELGLALTELKYMLEKYKETGSMPTETEEELKSEYDISEAYLIEVTVKPANDEKKEEEFIAYKLKGEGWKFDTTMTAMLTYVNKSKALSLNAAASTLEKALNSALTDLDVKGVDISGKYIISSESSLEANIPAKFDKNELIKLTKNYFDKLDDYKYFAVVEGGSCTYVACQKKDDAKYTGTYPANHYYGEGGMGKSFDNSPSFEELYNTCQNALK